MSEDVEENTGEAAVVAKEVKIEHLVAMVGNMNRFIALLANAGAFADAKLGLADWLIMGTVSSRSGVTSKNLAKTLGLAPQRVSQIVDRLKERALVSQGAQSGNALSLTEAGSSLLLQLNTGLQDMLRAGLNGNERSFFAVERHLRPLLQIIPATKTTG
ncbi:MAG: MarR family transcriptional regulator [Rhizomicrobium sp.]